MKHPSLLIAALILVGASAAQPPSATVFSKADPALVQVRKDVEDEGLLSEWRGRLRLQGKLVLEFRRVAPELNELYPEGASYFEPDATSLAKLPAALNNLPLSPKVIDLRTVPAQVLTPMLGLAGARAIVQGST